MMANTLQLYVWTAKTHGPFSLFVMAENEEQAREYVDKHLNEDNGLNDYYYEGWGTDDYVLTVYNQGQVVEHENS